MKLKTSKKHVAVRILFLTVLGAVLGLTIYGLLATTIGGNQLPMPFGYGVGVVASGSMEPELSIDDLIFVEKADRYQTGDWVVFQSGGILVVHEVISVDEEEGIAITQGRANTSKDAPVRLRDIKGRVIFSIPKVGIAVFWIKSPIGRILILALAGFLLWRSNVITKHREEQETGGSLEELRREILQLKQATDSDRSEDDLN